MLKMKILRGGEINQKWIRNVTKVIAFFSFYFTSDPVYLG